MTTLTGIASMAAAADGHGRARDILAERYARREITGEEYRERRDELR